MITKKTRKTRTIKVTLELSRKDARELSYYTERSMPNDHNLRMVIRELVEQIRPHFKDISKLAVEEAKAWELVKADYPEVEEKFQMELEAYNRAYHELQNMSYRYNEKHEETYRKMMVEMEKAINQAFKENGIIHFELGYNYNGILNRQSLGYSSIHPVVIADKKREAQRQAKLSGK